MPSVIVMGASVNTSSLRAKQIQLKTEPATLSCIAYALACNLITLQATQAAMCLARWCSLPNACTSQLCSAYKFCKSRYDPTGSAIFDLLMMKSRNRSAMPWCSVVQAFVNKSRPKDAVSGKYLIQESIMLMIKLVGEGQLLQQAHAWACWACLACIFERMNEWMHACWWWVWSSSPQARLFWELAQTAEISCSSSHSLPWLQPCFLQHRAFESSAA